MYLEDEKILTEIKNTKDLSPNTMRNYKVILKLYPQFHQTSMTKLLEEADDEEEQRIRMKKRKIKQRILDFREHLQKQEKATGTINTRIATIKSIYRFYEIELPSIPDLKSRQKAETINDIPTKKQIKEAIQSTNNQRIKAIILFMSSSGCARNETLNITIQDFIDATREYHNEITIENVVNSLYNQDNIIPTFHMHRQKTNYPYITFCSNEAVHQIILYLRQRINKEKTIPPESKLFNIASHTLTDHFERINEKLGWGQTGKRVFFHSHALRKFFATELLKADLDPLTIDFLSGRSIDKTREAYFKADPKKLKYKYMHFMQHITILEKTRFNDITSNEKQELEELRKERKKQEARLTKIEKYLNQLNL